MKTIEELYKFYGIEKGKMYKITKIHKDFLNFWKFEKGDKFKILDGDLLKFTDESKGTFPLYCLSNFDYKEYIVVLDEKEREYLSPVIKPFRAKVERICKLRLTSNDEMIVIYLVDGSTFLPGFPNGTMFKNMKLNEMYLLEELGL